MGVFVWALAPFLGCFGAVLLFASFPLAKRKSGWGICGSSLFVWLWFSLFVLIDLLISRTYVLVQCFSCLLSCKDRALARHRPISRKKNVLSLCPFRYRYPLPCHLACLLALVHLAPCSVTFPTISLNWSGSSWQQPADPP